MSGICARAHRRFTIQRQCSPVHRALLRAEALEAGAWEAEEFETGWLELRGRFDRSRCAGLKHLWPYERHLSDRQPVPVLSCFEALLMRAAAPWRRACSMKLRINLSGVC